MTPGFTCCCRNGTVTLGLHPPRAMLAPVLRKINCTLFSGKSIGNSGINCVPPPPPPPRPPLPAACTQRSQDLRTEAIAMFDDDDNDDDDGRNELFMRSVNFVRMTRARCPARVLLCPAGTNLEKFHGIHRAAKGRDEVGKEPRRPYSRPIF